MSVSREVMLWAQRVRLARKLALALAIAAVLSALATFLAVRGIPPFDSQPHLDQLILLVNLVLVLPLVAVVSWRLVQVWAERRRGLAGSRLHIRLVVLFSLVAVIPTIIVAVFSYLLFSFGVQAWFSERVRTALQESLVVAEAYLHEHQQEIRADVVSMANDLNREAALLSINPERLNQMVNAQAALRNLNEAVVFDGQGHVLARTALTFALELQPVPEWALQQARAGDVAVLTSGNEDRVRALVRLPRFGDVYLYVGRNVDPTVLAHMTQTQSAVAQYEKLEGERSEYQIAFTMVFFAVGILLLTGAVWVGLTFAMRLAKPMSALIAAAERVRSGDLTARLAVGSDDEEFGSLFRAFNRMTHQLESQQSELIEANRQLDQRRRFTETVLAGVSAGVIGLDQEARIYLPNRSASVLLGIDLDQMIGQDLADSVPEMANLLEEANCRPERLAQSQIQLVRDGHVAVLLVRIAAERLDNEVKGYVVTFDDVTGLISAQRKAAWSDVARRIAHEIKNPLTPIQLSAERLKRKYAREVKSDAGTFADLTETIIRHVGDIGRMVDEFSSFARMPAPVLREENLAEIVRRVVFLQRTSNPEIRFALDLPAEPPRVLCDSRQVSQALVNILKNAVEAIQARPAGAAPGEIRLRVAATDKTVEVAVEDNGTGLPVQERDKLTEPYVTTRASGTGLGLAIVKKIMEDHRGELVLEDREGGGARVTLVFGRIEKRADEVDARPAMEATHGT
jgi:two-component system, NtrC family, nitrogen regulation sensor histidine kinase NtrY